MATTAADLALLRAYEPVVRFTEGELFLPTAAGPYVEQCGLWAAPAEGRGAAELLVAPGELDVERLGRLGREHRDLSLQLRFVTGPPDRAALRRWRREERPRLRGSGRFASVGVFTRTIDSIMRASLLVRGRVPGGLVAAAELAARAHLEPGRCTYHGRVVRVGGYTVLQYWLFYVFNDWRSTFAGVNDHEADWELVCVYLADDEQGRPLPRWVAVSSHDHAGDELRRRRDDPQLVRHGDHPVIFAGAGSHSMAFVPDDYVVSVTLPALRRVLEAHVAELTAELERVDDTIARERVALWELAAQVRSLDGRADLRTSLALRRAELAARERALLATVGERARLATEIEAHEEHLRHPVAEAPDAHLRRTASGSSRPTVRRPRFLKVWAAVSTPLLVLTIVVLLTAPPLAFLTSVALFGGLFLGVEAAARGRLLSFLGGVLFTVLAIGAVVVLVGGLLRNWQAVLAALLTVAAVVLLVVNIRELRRG